MFTVGQTFPTSPRMYGDVIVLAVSQGDLVPAGQVWVTCEYGANVRRQTISALFTDCDECMEFPMTLVPHGNCIYSGIKAGHSFPHCTADACY